jgi:predicted secreted protein
MTAVGVLAAIVVVTWVSAFVVVLHAIRAQEHASENTAGASTKPATGSLIQPVIVSQPRRPRTKSDRKRLHHRWR